MLNKKPLITKRKIYTLVLATGIEPARVPSLDSKSSAYTSFAMPADRDIIHFIFKIINVELIYF